LPLGWCLGVMPAKLQVNSAIAQHLGTIQPAKPGFIKQTIRISTKLRLHKILTLTYYSEGFFLKIILTSLRLFE